MSTMHEADTLLAVDVGTVNTRASLFDVVDGRYRMVATGRASSTAGAPLFDVREGMQVALGEVSEITGRPFFDESEALLIPTTGGGAGVDAFVSTASAGPHVRTVLVGLMPGVSIESARRLAGSTYLDVIDEIGLTDRRGEEAQIDVILAARPDLIFMVGGTDGGATASVIRQIETVSLATSLLPTDQRPALVFAGNTNLGAAVMERFQNGAAVALVPNIRPSLEQEELEPARLKLAEIIGQLRSQRIAGFEDLNAWSGGYTMLTADAFSRVVRYLSRVYDPDKGVLGIDVGAAHVTVAAAFDGKLSRKVHSDLGLGTSLPGLLRYTSVSNVSRWLPMEVTEAEVRDYIFNKALYPGTIPAELSDLHIEYALLRELIRAGISRSRGDWAEGASSELMPPMEPIIASGGAIARAPRPGYAALALLDAVQPRGITTLVLDPYNLVPAVGAAAKLLPMITVQVLESGSFVSLGTVVSPVGRGHEGRPVLRIRIDPESGGEPIEGIIRYGQLVLLPLRQGEHARMTLRPERGFDVGFGGPGKAGALRVSGGALGVIIDARGRPIELSKDPERRRALNQKWLYEIGAMLES
ncbi:MAG: glutamate mutase L [Chloroflexi bacterium]|nr:glutamate mutase L [Chloroflexota bacterium]